jgi:methenyltetrahydrofolate cyclohydrolase
VRTETIEGYLSGAAAHAPVPGTGPGAALHAAQGAALVAAVARSSAVPPAVPSAVAARARERCDELRELALDLAVEDGRVAVGVAAAPRPGDGADEGDDGAEVRRAEALLAAGRLAVRVIGVTEQVLGLAEALRPVGGRAAAPGIAAAAEALRAAAGTARVNVEVALTGITDPVVREELLDAVEHVDDLVLRAAKVTAAVREQIVR